MTSLHFQVAVAPGVLSLATSALCTAISLVLQCSVSRTAAYCSLFRRQDSSAFELSTDSNCSSGCRAVNQVPQSTPRWPRGRLADVCTFGGLAAGLLLAAGGSGCCGMSSSMVSYAPIISLIPFSNSCHIGSAVRHCTLPM